MIYNFTNKKFNYWIIIVTYLYVLSPSVIFIGHWVLPVFAIPAELLILFTSYNLLLKFSPYWKQQGFRIDSGTILTSLIASLAFTYVSGSGEFINQFYDYLLHNAKFNLLVNENWPIYDSSRKTYMCYYLGYYLIPSGLGKFLGINSVRYISFIWLWLGLFLSLLWIHQIFKSFSLPKRVLVTFMIWSGAYIAIIIPLLEKILQKPTFLSSNSVFLGRGEMMLHYSSILKSVVEGPQHAITAILGGAMFLAIGCTSASVGIFSLFTIASLFWSPFVSIGLAPFTLYTYYLYISEKGVPKFFTKEFPILFLVLIGFLPLVLYTLGSSATKMTSNRFFIQTTTAYPIALYSLFLFTSVGVWILLFRRRLFELDTPMVCISFGTLSVLALFQVGYFNDLNNRASVPALLIIGLSIIHALIKTESGKPKDYLFIVGIAFWLLNTVSVFSYLYQIFSEKSVPANTIAEPYKNYKQKDYYNFMAKLYTQNSQEVIKQYSLNSKSIFQKYLIKRNNKVE